MHCTYLIETMYITLYRKTGQAHLASAVFVGACISMYLSVGACISMFKAHCMPVQHASGYHISLQVASVCGPEI